MNYSGIADRSCSEVHFHGLLSAIRVVGYARSFKETFNSCLVRPSVEMTTFCPAPAESPKPFMLSALMAGLPSDGATCHILVTNVPSPMSDSDVQTLVGTKSVKSQVVDPLFRCDLLVSFSSLAAARNAHSRIKSCVFQGQQLSGRYVEDPDEVIREAKEKLASESIDSIAKARGWGCVGSGVATLMYKITEDNMSDARQKVAKSFMMEEQ